MSFDAVILWSLVLPWTARVSGSAALAVYALHQWRHRCGRIAIPPHAKRSIRTRHAELAKVQALSPLVATFAVLGIVAAPSVGGVCCKAGSVRRRERDSTTRMLVGSVFSMPRKTEEEASQPAPRDKLLPDGWSVKVEHTLAGFPTFEGGCLHGKCERGEDDDGGNALQRVLGSACSSQSQREGYRNLCAGTRPGTVVRAEPAALPASAWR